MAKYKVLQKFADKETKEVYEVGHEIEMTVKRADEAVKNLAKYDGEFLERVDKPADPPADEGKGEQGKNQEDGK